jgi:hypothetical protein
VLSPAGTGTPPQGVVGGVEHSRRPVDPGPPARVEDIGQDEDVGEPARRPHPRVLGEDSGSEGNGAPPGPDGRVRHSG